MILRSILLNNLPTDFEDQRAPYIELYEGHRKIFSSLDESESLLHWEESGAHCVIQPNVMDEEGDIEPLVVHGEILLVCYNATATSLEHESVLRPLFQYSFHTGFLDVGVQDLDHQAIDVLYKKDEYVAQEFKLQLILHKCGPEYVPLRSKHVGANLGLVGAHANYNGLACITQTHGVVADQTIHEKLQNMGYMNQAVVLACQRSDNDYEKAHEILEDIHRQIEKDVQVVKSKTPRRGNKGTRGSGNAPQLDLGRDLSHHNDIHYDPNLIRGTPNKSTPAKATAIGEEQ